MRKDFSSLLYGLYSSDFFIFIDTLLYYQIPIKITFLYTFVL
jgi:hypothetical protein